MKTILITGGSSGVGKTLVEYFSNQYKVITIARRVEEMRSAFSNNPNVDIYKADLASMSDLCDVLNEITKKYQRVDCIINNAGIMHKGDVELVSTDDLMKSITVNAISPIEIVKFFLPGMKKNNFGRIINLTSGAPLNCFKGVGAYSASKSILNTLTVTLAKEMMEYDIKINLMSPGPVKSEMAPDALLEPSICIPTVEYLLNEVADTGKFYWLGYEIPLSPDLEGIDWLNGIASDRFNKIL
ncbi:SDR family NAD(P)-dependent oxidoreductase [Alistipes sp. ZOR0009]|uniref:SDR family NAD(P)-dependent oxidoreductase n=1 Tax=Alistipes sp. ZOR0009 TaxID=1339253 RepID=UPI0006486E74|nr:SDR family oxidoreductase [Alistipes sp. ZOR0009]